MKKATVKKWIRDRQIGYLTPDDGGEEVFFRLGSICNLEESGYPAAGQRVEYRETVNDRGLISYHVRILPDDDFGRAA